MNRKQNLWHVIYDYDFRSSSGMEKYTTGNTKVERYLATDEDSVGDLAEVLQSTLSNQEHLTRIRQAIFMGEIYCQQPTETTA